MFDTIVRGGTLVTSTGTSKAAIGIRDGRIAAIGPEDDLPAARETIDASGKHVLPGLIDCHCHFRGWEDYALATRMAAAAGLTTIIPFGITDVPRSESLPDSIRRHRDEIGRVAACDVAFHFQVGADPRILQGIEEAAKLGVRSFKISWPTRRAGRLLWSTTPSSSRRWSGSPRLTASPSCTAKTATRSITTSDGKSPVAR
jgi:dihydroorotase-like cyclic amidohydrolase